MRRLRDDQRITAAEAERRALAYLQSELQKDRDAGKLIQSLAPPSVIASHVWPGNDMKAQGCRAGGVPHPQAA